MWIKQSASHIAGFLVGSGLTLFLMSICIGADLLSLDKLGSIGAKFAGLALILGGGGLAFRVQQRADR